MTIAQESKPTTLGVTRLPAALRPDSFAPRETGKYLGFENPHAALADGGKSHPEG
jgi:hypothetical protein